MAEVETRELKTKSKGIIKKSVNPEFKKFVADALNEIETVFNDFKNNLSGKKYETLYFKKIDTIHSDLSIIKSKFELYATKFKFYTEETEKSLRKFGFLIKELGEDLIFNKEAFAQEANEIYLLNIVNSWTTFNASIKEAFYNIEHNGYPYTIHTVFSLAFVLVPFLNIFSLVGGIYLLTKKDWRALLFAIIILSIYFIQFVNLINLAAIG